MCWHWPSKTCYTCNWGDVTQRPFFIWVALLSHLGGCGRVLSRRMMLSEVACKCRCPRDNFSAARQSQLAHAHHQGIHAHACHLVSGITGNRGMIGLLVRYAGALPAEGSGRHRHVWIGEVWRHWAPGVRSNELLSAVLVNGKTRYTNVAECFKRILWWQVKSGRIGKIIKDSTAKCLKHLTSWSESKD